jgi:hypothetical protein
MCIRDSFYAPKVAADGGEIKKSEGTADLSARAMLDTIDSDVPVKRNLPKEAQDARRARIGQAPAVPQDYSGRDLTGELLNVASLATAPVPFLGDAAGLAADYRMYQMRPEERTMGNYALSALGVLPFIPSASATKTAVRSAEAIKEGAKRGIDLAEADRAQRALDLGHSTQDFYHASKQDLEEFKPGYDDGLIFLTPDATFANKWLGKGKLQTRLDDNDFNYLMEKQDQEKLFKKMEQRFGPRADWDQQTYEDIFNDKDFLDARQNIRNQYNDAHSTVSVSYTHLTLPTKLL